MTIDTSGTRLGGGGRGRRLPRAEREHVVFRHEPSEVPDPVLEAYLQAEYVVHARQGDIQFLIGHLSADLDTLLLDLGVDQAALITAFNPRSEPRGDGENRRAHERLLAQLDDLGCLPLPASGRDPQGHWAAEPSVLALGIREEDADRLGEQLEQNAYVLVRAQAAPQLIVLR